VIVPVFPTITLAVVTVPWQKGTAVVPRRNARFRLYHFDPIRSFRPQSPKPDEGVRAFHDSSPGTMAIVRRFYADEQIIMPQACARSLPASTPWNGHLHRIVIKFTGTLAALHRLQFRGRSECS
jgi:hypothetical protein